MLLSSPDAHRALDAAQRELEALGRVGFAPKAVEAVQTAKLERLWERARTTPYHARLGPFSSGGFRVLPITSKAVVKAHPEQFLTRDRRSPLKYYESSGTSGHPTVAPRFAEDIVWNTISVSTVWRRALQADDRVAILLPSDVSPAGDLVAYVSEYLQICALRCYPFAFGISGWDLLEALLLRYRPTCLFAAPGVMLQCMRTMKQRGRFGDVRASVERIMLLGEVNTPGLRRLLAQNWEAAVLDASYGTTETGTIAATCEAGRLHVLSHSFVAELHTGVEIAPIGAGGRGELVVSALNSFARPLLRYGTGDLVEIGDGSACACGLALPVIRVLGRAEEAVEVKGVPLDIETVEALVFDVPGITGYLIEVTASGDWARLVLEKDVDTLANGDCIADALQRRFATRGLQWDAVVMVNQLPASTKSGGGQKNWKNTNVRVLRDDVRASR